LEVTGDDVVAGRLIESDTGAWYRIDDGIADLVPSGIEMRRATGLLPKTVSIRAGAAWCRQAGQQYAQADPVLFRRRGI
jgi:hypothetical protein